MVVNMFLIYLCIILPIVNGHSQNLLDTTCNHPSDVVFLLDCSGSLRPDEFQEQLKFMKKFVDEANVSPNVVRIGLVTFSTHAESEFRLGDYKDKRGVNYAISRTRYRGGRTHTWLALDYVRKYAFSIQAGARKGVDKVLIIITDGGSNERRKTVLAVKEIKLLPIRIYAIGIGKRTNRRELLNLASRPNYYFHVQNSNSLKSIQNQVRRYVCQSVCNIWPADIVFLLDDSTSIWNKDYKKQMAFVSSFVNDSTIGPMNSLISVVTFSSYAKNQFWLRDHQSKSAVLHAIENINRVYGNTYTSAGLRMIRENSFLPRHGGRTQASHIVIVITDGKSTTPEETNNQAKKLHMEKTTVFAIGVGDGVDPKELNAIASSLDYVFTVASYSALAQIKNKVSEKVCTLHVKKVGGW